MKSYSLSLLLAIILPFGSQLIAQNEFVIKEKDSKFGLATAKGNFVIAPTFTQLIPQPGNMFAAKDEKGLWGFIKADQTLIPCLFDNFRFATPSVILVQKDSRWGAISSKGKPLIDFNYRYINCVANNRFKLGKFNDWKIRSFQNEIIQQFAFDSLYYLGENVYRFCLAGKYGLVDQKGKVITTEFQNIYESTLTQKLPKKEFAKAAPIIGKGDFKIPLEERFDTVFHFSEGFAKFKTDGKFGFVDSLGNIRLVPQYTNARHFSEGMVAVVLIGKWGFMDKNEKLCVQPYYDEVSDFKNGISLVRKGEHYNFINKNGGFLYGEPFDIIIPTYSGRFVLVRKNKVGMADEFGHEIISTKYEAVDEWGNGFIAVKEHGLWGIVDHNGNIKIPFNYSVIQYDPEHDRILTMEPGVEETITVTID